MNNLMNVSLNMKSATIFLLLLSFQGSASAAIELNNFWVVAAPSVATWTAIYGEIKNQSEEADTLISVSTKYHAVMVHKTEIHIGTATMLHQDNMEIAAQSSLTFKPMSYHLMVKNSDLLYNEDQSFLELAFKFKHAGIIKVLAPIRDPW